MLASNNDKPAAVPEGAETEELERPANVGHRPMTQFRPRTAFDRLDREYYCPDRDLAHLGIPLLRAAMYAFDEKHWEPWFREFMVQQGVTDADVGPAAQMLARAVGNIIETANPVEALHAEGFDKLPYAVQMALYTRLGQVLLAALWECVKDVRPQGAQQPKTYVDFVNAVDDFMANQRNPE